MGKEGSLRGDKQKRNRNGERGKGARIGKFEINSSDKYLFHTSTLKPFSKTPGFL